VRNKIKGEIPQTYQGKGNQAWCESAYFLEGGGEVQTWLIKNLRGKRSPLFVTKGREKRKGDQTHLAGGGGRSTRNDFCV